MKWSIQIHWNGEWVTVQRGFKSRDAAEWATGLWKQKNDCRGDPFRAVVEDALESDGKTAFRENQLSEAEIKAALDFGKTAEQHLA